MQPTTVRLTLLQLVCTHALAFSSMGQAGRITMPRRAVLSAPALAASAASSADAADASMSGGAKGNTAFSHTLTSVTVSGVDIPVAIWRPVAAGAAAEAPSTYPYKIDIGKIAAKLRVGWLSWLPKFDYDLPCGASEAASLPDSFPRAREKDAILFAHGFLGSVYDFAHAAEALAADGFVVVAPELPESLTASYIPNEGVDRTSIIAVTRERIAADVFGDPLAGRWGIFGHSAGAGSALTQPGAYTLGRALLAGGTGRMRQGDAAPTGGAADPLFICSSNGDGCNSFMGLADADLRSVITSTDPNTVLFESVADAYTTPAKPPPARGAFVFASDNTPAPLPCHISFLWSEVDDAMASLLSPLLPLAKALGLFLLDFDVYLENRDAQKTASVLVPALRRFFRTSAAR